MRIRKHENKNHYIRTPEGVWVRDFTKVGVVPKDINSLSNLDDKRILLKNEFENIRKKLNIVEDIRQVYNNVVIVSDGNKFKERHRIISDMPTAVPIGVNGSLRKWELAGDDCPAEKQRNMFYVVNNPYDECNKYLPNDSFYPNCLASLRTNPDFIKAYRGEVYRYSTTPEVKFHNPYNDAEYTIDDYRNSICAAICFANVFKVKKLLLLCCDDSFEQERPGSIETGKGTWMYPQQKELHNIIDANLFWLKQNDVEIAEYSDGPHYNNATYIQSDDEAIQFFKDDNE